jgi:predicted ATPase
VFSGSFPLAAAEAVGADDPLSEEDVVDVIDNLVGRSMVAAVDEGEESRFRLLEPVRQLAAEKLVARGEADAVRALRAEWYLGLIVRLDVAREALRTTDEATRWEALELSWEAAQRSHGIFMATTAAQMLGNANIAAGATWRAYCCCERPFGIRAEGKGGHVAAYRRPCLLPSGTERSGRSSDGIAP